MNIQLLEGTLCLSVIRKIDFLRTRWHTILLFNQGLFFISVTLTSYSDKYLNGNHTLERMKHWKWRSGGGSKDRIKVTQRKLDVFVLLSFSLKNWLVLGHLSKIKDYSTLFHSRQYCSFNHLTSKSLFSKNSFVSVSSKIFNLLKKEKRFSILTCSTFELQPSRLKSQADQADPHSSIVSSYL